MSDSNNSLTTVLGVDARDLQQSGFDPAKLLSSGMINGTCFCCSVVITGLTCNQIHTVLQL